MSSQRDQQKEVVRLLVLQHGQKTASELSQVPYETVRKWTQRGDWLSSQNVPKAPITVAADNVASELQDNDRETRLHWSRAARKHAERFAKSKPTMGKDKSAAAKNWNAVAATTGDWRASEKDQAQVAVNIAILSA